MKAFTQTETKELIELAKDITEKGGALTQAFSEFSKTSGKAVGSVRNHYYKTIKTTNFSKLGIPERLRPAFIKEFTRQEELTLLTFVIRGVSNGKSVRKCVYELASGNEKIALRYLNKYRALIKLNSPIILEAEELVKKEQGYAVSVRRERDYKFIKLEREINRMLDRILGEVVLENKRLLKESLAIKTENERLKSVVRETMRQKNLTKDYFASILERDAK